MSLGEVKQMKHHFGVTVKRARDDLLLAQAPCR